MAKCRCKPCLGVLAVLVVILAVVIGVLHQIVLATLPNTGLTLVYLAALKSIRAADSDAKPWYFLPLEMIQHVDEVKFAILLGGWKSLFGFEWVHPKTRGLDWSSLTLPSDKEARFCYALLSYMWSPPEISGFNYPSVYAGYFDTHGWIKSCKTVWHELGKEERLLLQNFRTAGSIPMEVNVPPPEDNEKLKAAARSKPLPSFEDSERLTREQIKEILADSISETSYAGIEPPESVVDYYSMMNMRKVVEIPGTWPEVGKAIRAGRITKFDATQLLPKELFNVSFATMAQWEGEHAKRIPVFGDARLPTSLAHFVAEKEPWLREPRTLVTAADEEMATVNGRLAGLMRQHPSEARKGKIETTAGYVHSRRLPEFHKKLPNIERLMGIEDDVLRGQSMLWLGATPGGFHYDEEANVYVQLSGVTFAHLVPQNWTDYFTGAIRHPWGSSGLPGWNEVEKEPALKDVPIYMIPLRPGDGITLHGRTYHRFMAQTMDRVSLNWFFIPGWRKMEYTPADWYSLEASRSLTRLAIRQLWARTLAKLYDDTGAGIIYMGTKLEYV